MSQKRTPPEDCYSHDELLHIEALVAHELFGCPITSLANDTIAAFHFSLQHLTVFTPRMVIREETERLCYALANRKNDLLAGKPVAVWQGAMEHEWAVHEVVSVTPVDDKMPLSSQEYLVGTRILSGSACGSLAMKLFSRRALVYLSPKMGFAKKPSDRQAWKISPYPRFLSIDDLKGLRWYGMLQPGHEYPPRYFEIKCNSAMLKGNRDLIRSRRNGAETKQQHSLVQPGEGPGVPDSPDTEASLRCHGAGSLVEQPCGQAVG